MLQIRIHARGGQGGKSLAQILAETSLKLGNQIQAFPEYGPERAGAPTKSFVRIDSKPIRTHEPIINPDISIVLDETLLLSGSVTDGLSNSGVLIVNTEKTKEEIKDITKFNGDVYILAATKISLDTIGINKPGSPISGALCRLTNLINIDALKEDIETKFIKKGLEIIEANKKAIDLGNQMLI